MKRDKLKVGNIYKLRVKFNGVEQNAIGYLDETNCGTLDTEFYFNACCSNGSFNVSVYNCISYEDITRIINN